VYASDDWPNCNVDNPQWCAMDGTGNACTSSTNLAAEDSTVVVFSNPNIELEHGLIFYASVRAWNVAGLVSATMVEMVTVDMTAPVVGWVWDTAGGACSADLSSQSESNRVGACWGGFSDAESGIVEYTWEAGWSGSAGDCSPSMPCKYDNKPQHTNLTTKGAYILSETVNEHLQKLVSDVMVHATVTATNGAGLSISAKSNGVKVITPEWREGVVSVCIDGDGTVGGGACCPSVIADTNVTLTWNVSVPGGANLDGVIDHYEWAIEYYTPIDGHTSNNITRGSFTSVSKGESLQVSLSTVPSGSRVAAIIRAVNREGISVEGKSCAAMADFTEPLCSDCMCRVNQNSMHTGGTQYQSVTTSVTTICTGFEDPDSGVEFYEWAVGTSSRNGTGGEELQNFTRAYYANSNSMAVTLANPHIELEHGLIFYISVRAWNGGHMMSTTITEMVTVDMTAPVAGWVWDTAGDACSADLSFQSDSDRVGACWGGFSDAESGIVEYRWFAGWSSSAGEEKCPPSLPCKSDNVPVDVDGQCMQRVNIDGQYQHDEDCQRVIPGTWSAATVGEVLLERLPTGSCMCSVGSTDVVIDSGTTQELVASTPVGLASNATHTLLDATKQQIRQMNYSTAVILHVTVLASNRAGLSTTASSNGIEIVTPQWHEGRISVCIGSIGVDGRCCPSLLTDTNVTATWNVSIPGVDHDEVVHHYEWAFEYYTTTTSGTNSTRSSFTRMPKNAPFVHANLSSVPSGALVAMVVRAVNREGSSIEGRSCLTKTDFTGPSVGVCKAGNRPTNESIGAGVYQSAATTVSMACTGFADVESGIDFYEWAVGTSDSGGEEPQNFTKVYPTTSCSCSPSKPCKHNNEPNGHCMQRVNVDGSYTMNQDCEQLLPGTWTTALAGEVSLKLLPAGSCMCAAGSTDMYANDEWVGCDASNPQWCESDGTGNACSSVSTAITLGSLTNSSVSTAITLTNLQLVLEHGLTFYISVRAWNGANMMSTTVTEMVTVDMTAPVVGWVWDNAEGEHTADVSYQSRDNSVGACWGGFSDAESGIVEYRWLAGWSNTSRGLGQIMTATSVGLATSAKFSVSSYDRHVVANSNSPISVIVVAYSSAGLYSSASSDGIFVDTSPPGKSSAWVHEVDVRGTPLAELCADTELLPPPDAEYQSSPALSTCWGGFDDVQSGFLKYHVGVSWTWTNRTNRAHTVSMDVEGYEEVFAPAQHYSRGMHGAGLSVAADELPAAGTIFHSWVRAVNRALLVSEVARSNGTVYDPTPPITGIVHDVFVKPAITDEERLWQLPGYVSTMDMEMQMGDMKDINCQPSNTTIAAQWERFADIESSIAFFEWAIGSFAGADNVQPFVRLSASKASAINRNLNLETGVTYYTTVRATNFANITSAATSNGVIISPNYAASDEICLPS
jgi:hypothetical protein